MTIELSHERSRKMWNWLEKLYPKSSQPVRKRVPIDIPFEQIETRPVKFEMPPTQDYSVSDLKDS